MVLISAALNTMRSFKTILEAGGATVNSAILSQVISHDYSDVTHVIVHAKSKNNLPSSVFEIFYEANVKVFTGKFFFEIIVITVRVTIYGSLFEPDLGTNSFSRGATDQN